MRTPKIPGADKVAQMAWVTDQIREPTPSEVDGLNCRGCATWGEYISDEADRVGMTLRAAFDVFKLLGPVDAFDTFPAILKDVADTL